MKIFFDIETRSKIDLKLQGLGVYSSHPSTEVISLVFIIPEINFNAGFCFTDEAEYKKATLKVFFGFANKGNIFIAHNSGFEQAIMERVYHKTQGYPSLLAEKWECTMSRAKAFGLAGGLGELSRCLNLEVKKQEEGKNLIALLCKPNKAGEFEESAELYKEFYVYNKYDVLSLVELYKRLPAPTPLEDSIYQLDAKMNRRGIRLDIELIEIVIKRLTEYKTKGNKRLYDLSHGLIDSAHKHGAYKKWLASNGYPFASTNKSAVLALLELELDPATRELLEIKRDLSRTSIAKFPKFVAYAVGDVLKHHLAYFGAHTGRWSSYGVQVHNLPRTSSLDSVTTIDEMLYDEQIATKKGFMTKAIDCLRYALIPRAGYAYIDVDFSQIEARVGAYLAKQTDLVEGFREGRCIYSEFASLIYNRPAKDIYDEYVKGDPIAKQQRALGKASILGMQYGMGWERFQATCLDVYGVEISKDLAQEAVSLYRTTYTNIIRYWGALTDLLVRKARASASRGSCGITLLSGRTFHFHGVSVIAGMNISYIKAPHNIRDDLYGGKIFENVCQAVARDIMGHAMVTLEGWRGCRVVLTVHDEILIEVPKNSVTVEQVIEHVKANKPEWAKNIPIDLEGWQGGHFK